MSQQPESQHHKRLTAQIVVGILFALGFAAVLPFLPADAQGTPTLGRWLLTPVEIGGDIFLRLLRMIVVPLVVTSVMSGVLGLGDIRKLGRPGLIAIGYYLTTTIMAVIVGLIVVNLVRPGAVDAETAAAFQQTMETGREMSSDGDRPDSAVGILRNLILMLFTDNLPQAAVSGELLPLIIFSIVFAGVLTTLGDRVAIVNSFILQLNDALMQLILLIMRLAPLGIFCLVAAKFGDAMLDGKFLETLSKLAAYFLTVLLGLAIHAFVTLPAVLYLLTRRNPYRFMLQISEALLTAFSTASSSATMPVTIEKTIDEAGVSRKSVDFVVPLGATINMDGTALYEAVAAIFIAQVLGSHLTLPDQIIVAITATLAAIGAAGIPEAGLVTMQIVLTSVGLPAKGMAIITSVDWLLDRFRTTVNVLGDAMGAAVVDQYFTAEPPATSPPAEPLSTTPDSTI
ncbi:MAG: dicarboxylate/amino acid:cation symporter [Planctomycetaceae bacterium]|nr:dicarboxylate/amino acid:cation symporter [Planctomycetaceae bacterium]